MKKHGYKVQLIEQMISTEKGNKVKPDVIAASNKLLNALVFECKGGVTLEQDQIERYDELAENDLLRWVDYYTEHGTSHDICLVGYEDNYQKLDKKNTKDFPMITFSQKSIKKNGGKFIKNEVEIEFGNEIDISKLIPPLSYYPFSEEDEKHVIIPYVLRATVALLLNKKIKKQLDVSDQSVFTDDRILRSIHPLWDILSIDHQKALKIRIEKIVSDLVGTYPKLKESIDSIKQSGSTKAISNLICTCEEIAKKEESVKRIGDFT